jgi:hypothetical protein
MDRASGGDGRSWLAALGPVAFGSRGLTATLGGALIVSTKTISLIGLSAILVAVLGYVIREEWARTSAEALTTPVASPDESREVDPVVAHEDTGSSAPATAITADTERGAAAEPDGVSVEVIDGASGEPVPSADVWYGRVGGAWNDPETDREVVLRKNGIHLVCDSRGAVVLPREGDYDTVVARSGDLYAEAPARTNEDTIVLRLGTDRTVTIQVVDESGNPLADVVTGIRASSNADRFVVQAQTAAPDGLARICHVDQRLPELRSGTTRFLAALGGILQPAVELALDPDHLPVEPIRLVMPATGHLVVVLENAAGEAARDNWVYVHPLIRREGNGRVERGLRSIVHSRDGRATFERVGLGLELLIEGHPKQEDRPIKITQLGPRSPGEEVVVRMRFTESYPVLVGRVLGEDGVPISSARIHSSFRVAGDDGESEDAGTDIRPDDAGEFRQALEVDMRSPRSIDGSLRTGPAGNAGDAGARVLFAEIHVAGDYSSGEIDLGDIVLREPPVVLSGSVRNDAGENVHWASISIARKHVHDEQQGRWNWDWVTSLRAQTDMDGAFTCAGIAEIGDYAYVANANGYSSTGFVPFEPGLHGIEIVLQQDGALEGSLLLPEGVPGERFVIAMRRSEEVEANASVRGHETRALPGGRFRVEGVRADRYDVQILLYGSAEPLHTVSGVRVESGETSRDPRLQEVDLRDRLRRIEIALEGRDGGAVGAAQAAIWPAGSGGTPPRRIACEDGSFTLDSPWPVVDVEIRALGYRPHLLESVSTNRKVTLEEGVSVVLELPPGLEPPAAPLVLRVLLIPSALYRRTFEEWIAMEDGGGARQWNQWLEIHAPTFAASRRIEVRLPEAGEYVVEWEVARDLLEERYPPQRVTSKGPQETLVITEEDAGRLIELGPDRDALRAAIEFWSTAH